MKLKKLWNVLIETLQLLCFAYVVLFLLCRYTNTKEYEWLIFASFVCFIAFDRQVFRFKGDE